MAVKELSDYGLTFELILIIKANGMHYFSSLFW